jgi:LDH2 family malate/lactate/ureidoglycolate dehydrogenase
MTELKSRMDILMRKVGESKKVEGFDRIYVSGEIEAAVESQRLREGLPYTQAEIDTLHELVQQSGAGKRLKELVG